MGRGPPNVNLTHSKVHKKISQWKEPNLVEVAFQTLDWVGSLQTTSEIVHCSFPHLVIQAQTRGSEPDTCSYCNKYYQQILPTNFHHCRFAKL